MNISFRAPLTSHWQHIHADWWQDNQGNDIHRVEIDDEALYHCHFAGSPLPWNAVATSLDEAMAVIDTRSLELHEPVQVDTYSPPSRRSRSGT